MSEHGMHSQIPQIINGFGFDGAIMRTHYMMYGGESLEKDLDKAWKNLLVAQHHDVQIVGLLPEACKLLPESYSLSSQVTDACMRFFANRMKGEGVKEITVCTASKKLIC